MRKVFFINGLTLAQTQRQSTRYQMKTKKNGFLSLMKWQTATDQFCLYLLCNNADKDFYVHRSVWRTRSLSSKLFDISEELKTSTNQCPRYKTDTKGNTKLPGLCNSYAPRDGWNRNDDRRRLEGFII